MRERDTHLANLRYMNRVAFNNAAKAEEAGYQMVGNCPLPHLQDMCAATLRPPLVHLPMFDSPLRLLSTECTEISFCLVKRQDVFFTFHLVYARLNTISWADLSVHLST